MLITRGRRIKSRKHYQVYINRDFYNLDFISKLTKYVVRLETYKI